MMVVKDLVEDLAHGIWGIRRPINLEEWHCALFDPLLCVKILKVHVVCTTTRRAMVGNHYSALIVFACGGRPCDIKTQIC
jgi:hypothetical protein